MPGSAEVLSEGCRYGGLLFFRQGRDRGFQCRMKGGQGFCLGLLLPHLHAAAIGRGGQQGTIEISVAHPLQSAYGDLLSQALALVAQGILRSIQAVPAHHDAHTATDMRLGLAEDADVRL